MFSNGFIVNETEETEYEWDLLFDYYIKMRDLLKENNSQLLILVIPPNYQISQEAWEFYVNDLQLKKDFQNIKVMNMVQIKLKN